jgi:hypothetical protein
MPPSGKSPDADPVGIEIVFGGIRSKPSNRSLAIFNLCWKSGDGRKTIIYARYGVSIVYKPNSWTLLFSASAPASPMDPNDHWQRTRDLLRAIQVEGEN